MPRLFVIQARDEPVAVIFRRGPTDWSHVIRWDTWQDRFEHGAWIKGRISPNKCDLSPDGRLMIYSVFRGSCDPEFEQCWTAISRPPWLTALTVWPLGTTYFGGGRFVDNLTVTVRSMGRSPLPKFPLGRLKAVEGEPPHQESSDEVPEADWCGRDHQGRLIWTTGGKLLHRAKSGDLLLADFTDLKPDPQPSPEWARKPV